VGAVTIENRFCYRPTFFQKGCRSKVNVGLFLYKLENCLGGEHLLFIFVFYFPSILFLHVSPLQSLFLLTGLVLHFALPNLDLFFFSIEDLEFCLKKLFQLLEYSYWFRMHSHPVQIGRSLILFSNIFTDGCWFV
jgi:hypothetical protein